MEGYGPTELLYLLKKVAQDANIDIKDGSWPKKANLLSRRLNGVMPNLAEVGIIIDTRHHTGLNRQISIRKSKPHKKPDATNAINDDSGTGGPDPEEDQDQDDGRMKPRSLIKFDQGTFKLV